MSQTSKNTEACNAKQCTEAKECKDEAKECKDEAKECKDAKSSAKECNANAKECEKCVDLKGTIAHGKACAKECAEKAKKRRLARPSKATLEHGKECAQECANVAKERSSHSDEIKQNMLHKKECASECAQKAKERAAHSDEIKHTHEHGVECAHECAEKALQRAHALGKDPVEISSEVLTKRKNLESVKDTLAATGRGPISTAICTLEDTFHRAVFWLTHAEALGDRSCEDKLMSYALWMQATHGDVCDCDRYLNQEEKARWTAWNKLKGMNRAEAMSRYVGHCAKVDANWLKDQMLDNFPTTDQVKSNVSNALEAVKNSTAEAGGAVLNKASELADSLLGNENQPQAQQGEKDAQEKNAKNAKTDAECASLECKESKESKECNKECAELKENRGKLHIKEEDKKQQATA